MTYRRPLPFTVLPDIPVGYTLDEVWSVIQPIARTNEVLNPSGETNTTGYTAGAGVLARSTEQQYHGAYSFKYTPSAAVSDGFYYSPLTTVSGEFRAISCKFFGFQNRPYALTLATSAGVDLVVKPFTASGRWQWITIYWLETSSTTRRIYFRKNGHSNVSPFYIDGVQSEVINTGELVSTYIDGDQLGLVANQSPPAYLWTGVAHASQSVRSGQTRAGGMVVPFSKYNFLLTAIVGLGLAMPQNVSTEYARIDGSFDDYTRKPERQFTITGRFQGSTAAELRRQRSGLAKLLDRDLVSIDQNLVLLRHTEDNYDQITSNEVRLLAKYATGLGGNSNNLYAETVPLTFTQNLPMILADGESGAALDVQDSVTNANYILQRPSSGAWSAVGTGGDQRVSALAEGQDGIIYAGGFFTAMGGVGSTNRVARWNPFTNTWLAMGSGSTGNGVYTIAVGPDGSVVYGGDIATNFGGVATTANLAKWNPVTLAWSSITPAGAPNGIVVCSVFDNLGNLYVGGTFTTINAVAANRVAKMTPAGVWSALSTGSTADVNALVVDKANNLYLGSTGNMGPGAIPFIAKWNGTAYSALGSAINGVIYSLAFDDAGNLYAGGTYSAAGTIPLLMIGKYNGVDWAPLGTGIAPGGGTPAIFAIVYNPVTRLLYIGGDSFLSAGGFAPIDNFLIWNGSQYIYQDIDLPGAPRVNALLLSTLGTLYIGYTTSGTATAAGRVTITNPTSTRSYPTVVLTGPTATAARFYSLTNYTTGRSIQLSLTLNPGETAKLVLDPQNLRFTSDFQGDIAGTIMSGSNEAEFFLQPGANVIAAFSAGSTVVGTVNYRPAYVSLDEVQ